MLTLLIDNHDSFTYNLFQLLWEVNGAEPVVVRNDEASWEELAGRDFDAVVISPGPGRPERERDFGVCAEAIRGFDGPLLGVCLGHQGIGWVNGATVAAAPEAMHGRLGSVEHSGAPLFAGIPIRFEAVRYHSLCLGRPLPSGIEAIAWAADGVPMAIADRRRPHWGVQFHPESVAAEHGRRLLANFRDLALDRRAPALGRRRSSPARPPRPAPRRFDPADDGPATELLWRRLDLAPDAERLFAELYGESRDAFWLDSSRGGELGRFSFMGDPSGPLGLTLRHRAGEGEPLLDRLARELRRRRPARLPDLPFEFACGFAGYLGYEMKAECGGERVHEAPRPDAQLVFADRMIVLDHEHEVTYLLCLVATGVEDEGQRWLAATADRITALEPAGAPPPAAGLPGLRLSRPRERYLFDVERCRELLRAGESYEICLTNSLALDVEEPPLDLYRRLRRVNPAPFAAYLRFGELAVLSSSPERFVSVGGDGLVEARPIKGTVRRGRDAAEDARLAARLAADEKNRAENLMIVDLLRNDLGVVCEPGSVEVPSLMRVESYETVHQLVSTVRGRLRDGASAADCVRACFPPGSMTGAPKLRTTEILDELEEAPRGVYSGAIGWFGLGGGCDLSVAIRTIVVDGGRGSVGAGGAIVLGSDPAAEYEEMLLKAAAPLRALDSELDSADISLTEDGPAELTPPPAPVPHLTS